MSLRIFGTETGEAPPRKSFADDIVGRFRSGYVANKRPVAVTEWRVTTGDPDVADAILLALGGDDVQEWEATGEDNLEVFTKASEVDVILDGPRSLRQRMILWGRNGKIIRESDGEVCTDGTPDPQAGQTLAERKAAAREGTGSEPQIEVYFRLASNPDLGIFKFQTRSWSMAADLGYHRTAEELAEIEETGSPGVRTKAAATLSLEEVSFQAKTGPRAGQTVTYTKPVLKINGPAQ